MAFAPVFQRPFPATFSRAAAAAAVPWYLAGGAPTPVAVYQPKGAASLAASYTNLANPGTYDAVPGVAPTLDASGWVFDGSLNGRYLVTGITPANDQTWSVLIAYSGATASDTSVLFGSANNVAPPYIGIYPRPASVNTSYQNGSFLLVGAGAASGVVAIAGNKPYRDGVAQTGTIPTGAGTFNAIFIGARNGGASPNTYYIGNILAVAIWNTSTDHAIWMPAVSAAVALI